MDWATGKTICHTDSSRNGDNVRGDGADSVPDNSLDSSDQYISR